VIDVTEFTKDAIHPHGDSYDNVVGFLDISVMAVANDIDLYVCLNAYLTTMITGDVRLYHAALHHDNCTASDMLDGVNTGSRIYDVTCRGFVVLDASDMVVTNIKVYSISIMGICHIFINDAAFTRIRGLDISVHWNFSVPFEIIQYDYYNRICATSDCVGRGYTAIFDLASEMNADNGHNLLLTTTILQYYQDTESSATIQDQVTYSIQYIIDIISHCLCNYILKTTYSIVVPIHYGGEGSRFMHHVGYYVVFANKQFIRSKCTTENDSGCAIYVCNFDHYGFLSMSYASDFHEHITGILFDYTPTSADAISCGNMSGTIVDDLHCYFTKSENDAHRNVIEPRQSQHDTPTSNWYWNLAIYADILDTSKLEITASLGGYKTTTTTTTATPTSLLIPPIGLPEPKFDPDHHNTSIGEYIIAATALATVLATSVGQYEPNLTNHWSGG
jgi:hypothetical protein